MRTKLDTWQKIQQRAAELAMIHGGKPTSRDWSHAARELLEFSIVQPRFEARNVSPEATAPSGNVVLRELRIGSAKSGSSPSSRL